jgi:LPXTG-motif cell wall-anchored protein
MAIGVAVVGTLLLATQVFAASLPQSSTLSKGTLNTSIWTQVLGQDSHLSLTKHAGWLSIGTEYSPNASYATTLHNMVLQPIASSANWTVSVETTMFGVKFGPTAGTLPNYVNGGIYAWQNATNWVRMLRQPSTCYIGLGWDINGKMTPGARTAVSAGALAASCNNADDPLWIRLTKQGDVYTGYYSTNGTTWYEADSTTAPTVSPAFIGLNANEGGTHIKPVDVGFKDFTASSAPTAPASSTATAPSQSQSTTSQASVPKTGMSIFTVLAGVLLVAIGSSLALRRRMPPSE